MPFINGRFYWQSELSAYSTMQNQRNKLAQAHQDFLQTSSATASTMFGAQSSLSDGLATISGKIALKRVQDALAAKKTSQLSGLVNKLS